MIQWEKGAPVWDEDKAKWKQLAQELFERIQEGRYRPHKAIPSISQLEQEFELSRDTIRQAVRHLIDRNVIRIETGVGTFVRPVEDWRPTGED